MRPFAVPSTTAVYLSTCDSGSNTGCTLLRGGCCCTGRESPGMPSEHETVAYLVVPLLRALGWTPQRMAVEWNHVDVALFEQLPRSDKSLRVVAEAKKMDNSCLLLRIGLEVEAEGQMFTPQAIG